MSTIIVLILYLAGNVLIKASLPIASHPFLTYLVYGIGFILGCLFVLSLEK